MYGMPQNFDAKITRDETLEPVSLETPYGKVSGHPHAISYLKSLMDDDINQALGYLSDDNKIL